MDIQYELEKKIIKALRNIFAKDDKYVYNDNEEYSKIKITLEYPDDGTRFDTPHIVVSSISVQNNLHDTIGYNFYKDVEWKGLKNGAQQYMRITPYNMAISCFGTQNDSKDISSKIVDYVTFSATNYLSEQIGLKISAISKSNTMPIKQYPRKYYKTDINISGTHYWIDAKGPEEPLYQIDKPLKGLHIKFL